MDTLKQILQLPFLSVYLNEDAKIFECTWHKDVKDKKRKLGSVEFKNHLEKFANLFGQYPVRGFYVDTKQYDGIMTLEIQKWHDEHIIPQYIEAGVTKIAFLKSDKFISAIAIQQSFDEPKAKVIQTRFFHDSVAAKQWILA